MNTLTKESADEYFKQNIAEYFREHKKIVDYGSKNIISVDSRVGKFIEVEGMRIPEIIFKEEFDTIVKVFESVKNKIREYNE